MPVIASCAIALALLLAGCGGDDPAPDAAGRDADAAAETTPAPTAEAEATEAPQEATEADPAGSGDEPSTVSGRLDAIEYPPGSDEQGSPNAGVVVLTVTGPEGRERRIVVPGDLALGDQEARVLRDPACVGAADGEFVVVDTPEQEELGESLLVEAELSRVDC